jgi:O-phosphoseryl-tRNA synthetase
MAKLRPNDILKRVERNGFESVWQESASILHQPTKRIDFVTVKRGVSHPVFDLIQTMRQSFLNLGFMEVSNPIIVDETEVYKQYGSEASVILDRCYYLATLSRPEIGLSKAKCQEIERRGVQLTEKKTTALQKVLRDYKKGKIDSDDLVEKIADSLDIQDSMATLILSEVFPEFASLKPEPSTLTLRSHMTSSWFLTLQALQHKLELPIKLFSVDVRFRREQREDSLHLRAHHAASCVIMNDEMDVRDGEEITKASLKPVGLERFRFVQKKVTSKYYVPETEHEVFIFHSGTNRWIEVADYGLYNPVALARYDLEYPILNVGIGLERVASALYAVNDIRELVYPQFYSERELSDSEIAKMVKPQAKPQSDLGIRILEEIKFTALKHAEALAPCEFLAYEGKILDKKVKVYVYETETETRLLGPASLNGIVVYDGNILGVPEKGMEHVAIMREAQEKGCPVGFNYIDAIASLAAAKIEEAAKLGLKDVNIRITMAKHPSDVNINISDVARRYITRKKRKIKIDGPVFVGVRAEIINEL